jgi:hypothetical protein
MRPGAALVGLALAAACAKGERQPFQARFAVRGRWPGDRSIAVRIEPDGGPLAPAEFRIAIERALAPWQSTGCVVFHPAAQGESPGITFAWRRGAHDACQAFGTDTSIAHTGPVGPDTFVHFDAAREWNERGESLERTALHEIGHALGLDHSDDETALMFVDPSHARAQLAASDLAGLRSLYGGPCDGRGDLSIRSAPDAAPSVVLHDVAPRELCAWDVFDTDGDGDEEILVWRTDRAGSGALRIFHFAAGPALERSVGPLYGVVALGAVAKPVVDADGRRLFVTTLPDGRVLAHVFDEHGGLASVEPGDPALLSSGAREPASNTCEADLDGDGNIESISDER